MKHFLNAAKLLFLDLASTLFFLVVYLLTHNTALAVGLGIAFGLVQIGSQLIRRTPVHAMEWLSLSLIVVAGIATLLTHDVRFVLFKPSVIYAIVGIVMLKRGWLNRYVPEIARTVAPDIATAVGYAWAGLMFVSAAVNAFVALTCSLETWAVVMPIYGIVSKVVVFVGGFAVLRMTVRRRLHAMPADQRDALLALDSGTATASP
ncbi:inner membrane-spanning protein YciB [Bradyrhizobium ivorense]|uniref:inner membrane-spanning protein YciB n=1 Tax=Bradyrhizobium ivorense TaxID=2511166 RepID=UPI0010B9EEFA|nr:septation protein IspZ [Bradyrhizobium ivorense]VIO67458.1 intracellular septation protein A [Bradyrhizobium ivorense]